MPDAGTSPSPSLLLEQGQYAEAVEMLEQAIEQEPSIISNYWFLGLALLLKGQEEDAQVTWMTPLLEAAPEQAEQWVDDLFNVLDIEATRQEANSADEAAWLIRQHIRAFAPEHLDNLLQLMLLGIKTNTFSYEDDLLPQIIQELQSDAFLNVDRLLQASQQLLAFNPEHIAVFNFLAVCAPHFKDAQRLPELVRLFLTEADRFRQTSRYTPAIHLAKFSAQLAPEDSSVLLQAVSLMQSDSESMIESLPITEHLIHVTTNLCDRIFATHFMLSSLMLTCGSWQMTQQYYQMHQSLLESVDYQQDNDWYRLLAMGMYFPYFADDPARDRPIRNHIAQVSQEHYRTVLAETVQTYQQRHQTSHASANQPLKIGYLSDCLRVHSVGWLARWLLKHHDRQQFDIYLYSTRQSNDLLQHFLMQEYGDRFQNLAGAPSAIADRIYQDEIDILVELDSLTAFTSCAVAALKPAPIQVSWLGFDASGLPAIDYYIADPYVLPEDAQSYYQETIWRLPQTYIAVDGFEVGVPSLRRDQLGIPGDAVVYLSSQSGLKRNPDNIRLQLRILKEVPNSYFLIKSFNAQPDRLQAFFYQLAEEEGVSGDRLRFLPDFASNAVYRASLGLADVILDTYPYNGATTTLEALWMGLPIVTQVGKQFAARNSYTMLMNAGVTAGIAWNEAEYLEWGVRLGQDVKLRSEISYQLRKSRQSAPLWNTKQFAREMEQAYGQMWVRYLERR